MSMIISGLPNFGATCYLNSLLQCLNATCDLYEYLGLISPKLKPESISIAILNLFTTMRAGDNPKIHQNLVDFIKLFSAAHPTFAVNTQQDSQEFYTRLLDTMDEEISETYNKHSKHKSIIKKLFNINQITKVKCTRCKTIVSTSSFARYIYVNKNMEYYKEELLSGANKYACEKCKSLQDATKQIIIESTPKILVLVLAKYEDTNIHMNISEELPYNGKMYIPYGIVTHSGSLGGGHYISQCKFEDSWYLFNDSTIHPIGKEYSSRGAFMVFYRQKID